MIGKQFLYALIIFILFFGGVELILALSGVKPISLTEDPLVGFAANVPLFVEERRNDNTPVLKTAKNKLVFFNYQEFPKAKDTNSYRIFCVGGSTTFGRPFRHKVSFCGWLETFLNTADSGRKWEVINAGGVSYASYRVANQMRELVQYQPDLFIVYTGQNEFLEERSYGRLADLPSWMIYTYSVLNSTRTYSGMKRLYDAWRPNSLQQARKRFEVSGEVDDILTHTLGPISYHRDDDLRRQILTHYRLNLERIVRLARDAGAEVIFVKPVVNLKDMSPFKSEHREGLAGEALNNWNRLFEQAKMDHAAGKFSESLVKYRQALHIDDRYAELHFQIGRVLFDLGSYDEAESSFWRAVDEDIAPLRMLSSMATILSSIAARHDVPLVDFQQILRQAYLQKYDHSVFGKEFFLDHVHTNVDGYRLLGLGLFEQLSKQGVVSPDVALNTDQIATVTQQVSSSLSDQDHGDALYRLAKVLDWAGKFDEAENLYLKNLELFGPRGSVFAQLGETLASKDNTAEAIDYFLQALNAGYEKAWVYRWLGDLYSKQGKFPLAIKAYQDQLRLDGNDHVSHNHLGLLLVYQGDTELTRYHFNEALRLKPDFLPVNENLVALLFTEQQYNEALVKGRKIISNHPDKYKIHYVVGAILLQQGNRDQAIKHFTEALRIAPDFKEAQDGLKEARGAHFSRQ